MPEPVALATFVQPGHLLCAVSVCQLPSHGDVPLRESKHGDILDKYSLPSKYIVQNAKDYSLNFSIFLLILNGNAVNGFVFL